MNGQSLNIKQETLQKLKEIIPHCFTEDKLDWEKLRVFFEDNIEFRNERYHLSWAGKTDAIRLLQTPTYNTLKPCREESVNFDATENLFIEGDNLEVLKILQKSYFGKIKMIYIDPPYNTGNDFIYKDDYSETLAEYRKKVGDVDENGNATRAGLFRNTKENGQYHSNWLNMMYPRLFLARNLLRDDGVIFVSIDDNEVHNLRLIMDEIFGEENFVAQVIAVTNRSGRDYGGVARTHEYILVYQKSENTVINEIPKTNENGDYKFPYKDDLGGFEVRELRNRNVRFNINNRPNLYYAFYLNPDELDENGFYKISLEKSEKYYIEVYPKISNGIQTVWRWGKEKAKENLNINLVGKKISDGEYQIVEKYRKDTKMIRSVIDEKKIVTEIGTEKVKELFENKNLVDYPKSPELIKKLLYLGTNSLDSDIILDFFAGSGTTAHAVMELNKEDGGNRKFILVQLPEPTDPESEAYKAGYKTIADIAKERIRRAAKKIQEELNEEQKKKDGELPLEQTETKKLDLGFKVFKLDESNFKQWRPFRPENAEEIKQAVLEFTENVKSDAKTENLLYELILKNGKKLTDKMEKKNSFYVINENELVLLLEEINKEMVDEIIKLKPQKVIALDKIFNGNDQLKTNTVLQFKDAGVEFKSV
ncbi:MAG: site-specific DNA-methyltransferase [Brevinematales bacterium]